MTSSSNDGMNSVTSSADHGMDTSDIPLTSSANETQTAIADQASLPESFKLKTGLIYLIQILPRWMLHMHYLNCHKL